MDCPKFWISKNVQFRHMCGAFKFWSNFGWPKIWGNPCWSPPCIALACYPWLILVINCNNEVCSSSNNTVSKAFWQKKVLPKQRISCCGGVIYILRNLQCRGLKEIPCAAGRSTNPWAYTIANNHVTFCLLGVLWNTLKVWTDDMLTVLSIM